MDSEEDIIARIRDIFGDLAAENDDDDTVRLPIANVCSTDQCIEGLHFDRKLHPMHYGGHRALVRNLSDIAAAGALPRGFVWALSIPPSDTGAALSEFVRGAAAVAADAACPLLGGDISRGDVFSCTITIFGHAEKVVSRAGAQPGDGIYLSGSVGHSASGLGLLQNNELAFADFYSSLGGDDRRDVDAYLMPVPPTASQLPVSATAAMDVSDGIGLDLARLCRASKVGARIEVPMPKVSGDDYVLLYTAPRADGFRIGEVSATRNIVGIDSSGFLHFS